MKNLLIVFVLLFTFSYAQTIKKIEFKGLVHLSKTTALEMLHFGVNDSVDDLLVSESIKIFYAQKYFTDIQVFFDNGVLTYQFTEKPLIAKIDYSGYFENDDEKAKEIITLKKGDIYDIKKIEKTKAKVIEYLQTQGYVDSIVEVQTNKINDAIELNFVINRGEEIEIEKLSFYGNESFDRDTLEKQCSNRQKEFMGWFIGRNDGEMKFNELEIDSMRLKEYYMQEGFLDVDVNKPIVKIDFDRYKAKMSYDINEGIKYNVSSIKVIQIKEVATQQELNDAISLDVNKTFRIKTLRKDMAKLKNIIADYGYAFVQIYPRLDKNKDSGVVNVTYEINPGKKVHIRDVVIDGNNRTLDRVIRREIYIAPGDLYSQTDFDDSKKALGRTGYFDSQTIELKRINDEQVDIFVSVKEAPTGTLQVGGGYGSYAGFMVDASVSDRNIFGSGINVNFTVSKSEVGKNLNVGFSNPRFNDSLYSYSFNIFRSDFDYIDYSTKQEGISNSIGKKYTRDFSATIGHKYIKSEYFNIDDLVSSSTIAYTTDPYTKSSLVLSGVYNTTDDYFIPREGVILSDSVEYAGFGGSAKFIKNFIKFAYYQGLEEWLDADIIFRAKARHGYIAQNGFLPYEDKFYLGGVSSLRGYESYSLSPETNEGVRIGGKQYASSSLELSFPVIPESKLRVATFFDYGMIGENGINEISRKSYGAAIEWYSPMGPIQLIFARAISPEDSDRVSNFEFTLGQRF